MYLGGASTGQFAVVLHTPYCLKLEPSLIHTSLKVPDSWRHLNSGPLNYKIKPSRYTMKLIVHTLNPWYVELEYYLIKITI